MKHLSILFVFMLFVSQSTLANGKRNFQVTVTNITKGISFTPLLGVAHSPSISLFSVGETASEDIAAVAEGGNIAPLMESLEGIAQTSATSGLLGPGETVTFEISVGFRDVFSMVSMLLPTNDTMVAIRDQKLPLFGAATFYASAYDAGSETNDELCVNIPGPACGGSPFSPEDSGEGYVFPSPGIHGEADLSRSVYNWQGPVAKVVVQRVY